MAERKGTLGEAMFSGYFTIILRACAIRSRLQRGGAPWRAPTPRRRLQVLTSYGFHPSWVGPFPVGIGGMSGLSESTK